jgi:AcrR family transcriptional regulator
MTTVMNVPDRPPALRGRRPAGAESGREALLAAAMGAFARLGYEGSSLRALSSAAGVDMALVARLFGSKAALWDAVVDRLAKRQAEHAETLVQLASVSRQDPGEGFRRFVRFFADLSLEMPAFPAFLLQEAANPGERLDTLVTRLVHPFRDRCRPIIGAAIAAGVVRGSDPDIVFGMLVGAISLPLVSPALFTGEPAVTAELRDRLANEAVAMFGTVS